MGWQRGALILSLVAALAFGGAFWLPFTHSDFDLNLPNSLESTLESATDPCDFLDNIPVPRLLRDQCNQRVQGSVLGWLDRSLGPVDPEEDLTWQDCIHQAQDQGDPEPWRVCTKTWIIEASGIPVGDRWLLGIIRELVTAGEVPLAVLLGLFSVAFPWAKVGACVGLGALPGGRSGARGDRPARSVRFWLKFLSVTSKWSMTDVFVVALVIVFFKAESFNFQVEAQGGAYCFAAGAVLSSLAAAILEAHFHRRGDRGE